MPRAKKREAYRKITLLVPTDLLESALEVGGDNLTQTVRKGLELIAARAAYDGLKKYKGKVRFSIPLEVMRFDR